MWILDSCVRQGIDLWVAGDGKRVHAAFEPAFYLCLPDPHSHREMIEALEAGYPVNECTFETVYGSREGYRICAGREVAEAIEQQTGYDCELYNVDIRADQRYMAEAGIFPCGYPGESRFSPDFESPLTVLELSVPKSPDRGREIRSLQITGERTEHLSGSERAVLSDLGEIIGTLDPDVILCPYADTWIPRMVQRAQEYGISLPVSRSGHFRTLASRSYWSYGRVARRAGALIPEGRILIDTEQSFSFREGGLCGILLTSRLSGICPNFASRFTPGTLISSYEIYEGFCRGIAVPFRKRDAEGARKFNDLRSADRGGMIFQPDAGVYEGVDQLDFTSLYPTIIVKFNLSPETLSDSGKRGFLPAALAPLLDLRIRTKQLKKGDRTYAGRDAILKWMLVTCFGYTGYKNARFGRIEVHERITSHAREILLRTKEIAEEMGFTVLHGIIDCLWVQGESVSCLKARVEGEIGISTEIEAYDWIAFLPIADGGGASNRYFGRLCDGTVKVRGIMARRRDTPEYVQQMQHDMLAIMSGATNRRELAETELRVAEVYRRYLGGLSAAAPDALAIRRRVSRLNYARSCMEGSAVKELLQCGMDNEPGMEISYVVRDAARCEAAPPWAAAAVDHAYYARLLEKAWTEIAAAFGKGGFGCPGN